MNRAFFGAAAVALAVGAFSATEADARIGLQAVEASTLVEQAQCGVSASSVRTARSSFAPCAVADPVRASAAARSFATAWNGLMGMWSFGRAASAVEGSKTLPTHHSL